MAERNAETLERGRNKRAFLYAQIAEKLRQDIANGVYAPGDRMMSMDRLAERYSVNKITICRAMKKLSEEGLVYSVPSKGVFVAEPKAPTPKRSTAVTTIGIASFIMIPGRTGHYHLSLQEAIRSALGERCANLVVLPAAYVEPRRKVVDIVAQTGLDGVICIGPFETLILRQIVDLGLPVVLLDHIAPGMDVDVIGQDNCGGAYLAMRHLLNLGHRDIAVVKGLDHASTRERLEGVRTACNEFAVDMESLRIEEGQFIREGGYEATLGLLHDGTRPTAIFYFNDEMAMGGLQALQEEDLSIPDDMSIIGFDDVPLAGSSGVGLTTIHAPTDGIGRMAVDLIYSRMEDPARPGHIARLCMSLVERESTAAIQ